MDKQSQSDLYHGLKALAESSFPKRCNTCGRKYASVEEFIADTNNVANGKSGLKASAGNEGENIIELYRNCPCGSTLMDAFNERRDLSDAGETRRNNFDKLLNMIVKTQNLDIEEARLELRKILRGETSEVIKNIKG